MGDLSSIVLAGMQTRASAIREAGRVRRESRKAQSRAIGDLGESIGELGNMALRKREEDELRALDETFTQGLIEFGDDEEALGKAIEAAMANRPKTPRGTQKLASYAIQAEAITTKRRAEKLKAEAERQREKLRADEEARRKLEAETEATKAGTADRKQTAAEKAAEDKLRAQTAEDEDTAAVFAPQPGISFPAVPSLVPGMPTPQMSLPARPPTSAEMMMRLGQRKNVPSSVRNAILSQYATSVKPVKPTEPKRWQPTTMEEAAKWAEMQAGIKAQYAPKPKPPATPKRQLPEGLKLRKEALLKQLETAFTADAQEAAQAAMKTLMEDIAKWENGGTAPAPTSGASDLGLTPDEQAEYDAMSPKDQEEFRKALGR